MHRISKNFIDIWEIITPIRIFVYRIYKKNHRLDGQTWKHYPGLWESTSFRKNNIDEDTKKYEKLCIHIFSS